MAFRYSKLTEADTVLEMMNKVNSIGVELSKPNSIYKEVQDLKDLVKKHQTYRLTNDNGLYSSGDEIDINTISGAKTSFGYLNDPPKGVGNKGWVEYKESDNRESAIVTFNPLDSENTYRKIRKLPKQEQNPNLLKDTIFTYVPARLGKFTDKVNWDKNNTPMSISDSEKYLGLNTIQLEDLDTTYPHARHKGLEVGKDVNVGDKVTLSVYYKVPDIESIKDNGIYIEICGYPQEIGLTNPKISQTDLRAEDLVENEWTKISVTATIPSTIGEEPIKYISALLRINSSKSGRDHGFRVFYALPKLEKGDKVTPYVSHPDDKIKFNELWSEWIETKNDINSIGDVPTDIMNNNYFKYAWWADDVEGKTLQELCEDLPQGMHTFYAQKGIEGILPNKSVRGIITIDYSNGDITQDKKFVQLSYMDWDGITYNQYFDANVGWAKPVKNVGSFELWTGTQDFGGNMKYVYKLNDSINNYDYIDIEYYTNNTSRFTEVRRVKTSTSQEIVITSERMDANDPVGTTLSTWQAEFSVDNSTQLTPVYCKRIIVNSSGNRRVAGHNTSGLFTIKRIVGIKE